MRTVRQYTEAQRAEARARAAAIGPVKAAKELGIPVRTVNYWTHQPAASPIIAAADLDVALVLRGAFAEAIAPQREAIARLRGVIVDPRSKPTEVAQASRALTEMSRVLGEQSALAEGRATANIETHTFVSSRTHLDAEAEAQLRDWLDAIDSASDEELNAAAPAIKDALQRMGDV